MYFRENERRVGLAVIDTYSGLGSKAKSYIFLKFLPLHYSAFCHFQPLHNTVHFLKILSSRTYGHTRQKILPSPPQCLLFRRFFLSVPSFVPFFAWLGAGCYLCNNFLEQIGKNTQTPYIQEASFPSHEV